MFTYAESRAATGRSEKELLWGRKSGLELLGVVLQDSAVGFRPVDLIVLHWKSVHRILLAAVQGGEVL